MRAITFSSLPRFAVSGLLFAVVFSAYTKVLGKVSGIGTTVDFFRIELPLVVCSSSKRNDPN